MGISYRTKCEQCEHRFKVNEGGGFTFFRLHCDKCGRGKYIDHEQVETPLPPDWEKISEELADQCRCGGQFLIDAPPRCPKCKSSELVEDPENPDVIYYD